MTLTIQHVKVAVLALAIPTALVTIIRLGIRARARNLGLDDAFAASSLAGFLVLYVGLFLHLDRQHLAHYSFTTRYMTYYMMAESFYWIIWSARLSILFIVIRITPPHTGTRRALHFFAWSFGLAWGILAAQLIWVCEKDTNWKMAPAPQCRLGFQVAIAQLISDIIADSILIAVPLRLLWKLDKRRPERRRLLVVFSSSIITTTTSLIHAYYILRVGGLALVFTAVIETCSSLFVCNLAIIVTFFCRIFRCGGSRTYVHRTVDLSLDLRSHENSETFRFRQETDTLATENGTVINLGLNTYIQGKADPEALFLSSKPDTVNLQITKH